MPQDVDLEQLIADLIGRGELADAQYAIARDGEVLRTRAFGDAALDSRFCIFSSTKPVFASLIWRLIDDGEIKPDTRVVDIWPEFGANGKDTITLEHLLLFTAGIPSPMLPRDALRTREGRVREMESWEIEFEPGSRYVYHPFSAGWVLAELVTRITGRPHGEALRELVFDPLGLDRIDLGAAPERQGDVREVRHIGEAPFDPFEVLTGRPATEPRIGSGEPFDIRAFGNDPDVIAAGAPGGGAVSDAESVALFYQALLHNPADLWSPEILVDATTNIRNTFPDGLRLDAPANRTLGLIVAGDDNRRLTRPEYGVDLVMHPFGPAVSPTTFGHGGGGGQIAFADPQTGVSFCFLSNAIDLDAFRAFRNQQDIIEAAVRSVV